MNRVLPVPPEWQPVLLAEVLRRAGREWWALGPERGSRLDEVERRAAGYGLPPLRWPERWPGDTLAAMRAATFAGATGRAAAFSLAAFRQAFAAGRDLGVLDNVLIAAAACELHPRAVIKGIETRSTQSRLTAATNVALARGVTGLPTLAIGGRLFWGDDRLEEAAEATAIAGEGRAVRPDRDD